jgi:hypothetical protein
VRLVVQQEGDPAMASIDDCCLENVLIKVNVYVSIKGGRSVPNLELMICIMLLLTRSVR